MPVFNEIWAISSAGRAPGSQSGGQGFDPPMVHQRKGQPKGCPFLWWGTDAVRTPGSNTRISFAHAKAPRSGGAAAPAKSEVSRSEAEYPPAFHQILRACVQRTLLPKMNEQTFNGFLCFGQLYYIQGRS